MVRVKEKLAGVRSFKSDLPPVGRPDGVGVRPLRVDDLFDSFIGDGQNVDVARIRRAEVRVLGRAESYSGRIGRPAESADREFIAPGQTRGLALFIFRIEGDFYHP